MKSGTTGNIIQWYVLFIWVSAMILGFLMFDGYGVFLYLGLLMMIAFVSLIHIWDHSKDAQDLNRIHFLILLFIIVGAIFFVYYSYLIFFLFVCVLDSRCGVAEFV